MAVAKSHSHPLWRINGSAEDRGDGERASPRHVTVVGVGRTTGVVGRRPRGALSLPPRLRCAGRRGGKSHWTSMGWKIWFAAPAQGRHLHLHNCFVPIKNARSRLVGLLSSFAGRQYLMPVSVAFPDSQTCQPFSAWLTSGRVGAYFSPRTTADRRSPPKPTRCYSYLTGILRWWNLKSTWKSRLMTMNILDVLDVLQRQVTTHML